jgi:hypothetical protein
VESVPWLTVGGRTWLDDADRVSRRLAVHAHPERGWITLSVWDANECRATFHLRQADASRLIYQLAEGLAGAARPGPSDPGRGDPGPGDPGPTRPRPGRPALPSVVETGAHLLDRGVRWVGRLGARAGLGRSGSAPARVPPRLRAVADLGSQPDRSSG